MRLRHGEMPRGVSVLWFLALIAWPPTQASESPPAIRVLVLTGGHAFDASFFSLFEGLEGILVRHVEHPQAFGELGADRGANHDVLVLYDLYQGKPTPEKARRDLVSLLERGTGLVVLHHALASYGDWDEFRRIVGGRYYLQETREDGKRWPRSTYRHGVTLRIEIADPAHPIARGIEDFELTDETYNNYPVDPDVHPLLRTAHPSSARVIGWCKTYSNARVVYLQPGHGPQAFRHPSYRRLVERSIRWAARRLPAGGPGRREVSRDEAIRRAAPARIERHRQGPILVRVVDDEGSPVRDAEVVFRQRRHEFLFGCNIFLHGRIRSPDDEARYRKHFRGLFNFATLPFYWGGYEAKPGAPAHDERLRVARWCREHGITTKGHPLVWNHPASVPRWLAGSPSRIQELSEARTRDCVERFRGRIDIWDVVNEATDPWRFRGGNLMTEAIREIGVVDWTVGFFLAARKANPQATLLINDYRTDPEYSQLITELVHEGRPVYDAIGIQSHMHGGAWRSSRVWEVCERFARFGVPLHFTETTLLSGPRTPDGSWEDTQPELEVEQARAAVEFYTVLFSHPAVEAITWWDLADRRAWQGAAAGLLRKDFSPKPAYLDLRELIRRRWWTEIRGRSDAKGEARIRAFFGDYDIEVVDGEARTKVECRHRRARGRTEVKVKL